MASGAFGESFLVGYFFGATADDDAPADLVGFVDAVHLDATGAPRSAAASLLPASVRITTLSSSRR